MPVVSRRCACCRHPEDLHQHFTRASDTRCAECGPRTCPRYIDPHQPFPMLRMTSGQRETRRLADERQAFNAGVLAHYVQQLHASRQMPIPGQRAASEPTTLPPQRRPGQSVGNYYREALRRHPPQRKR